MSVLAFFIAAATVWPGVLVGRVVDRVGKGIRGAPRDALLADGVATTSMGKVFGFHRQLARDSCRDGGVIDKDAARLHRAERAIAADGYSGEIFIGADAADNGFHAFRRFGR